MASIGVMTAKERRADILARLEQGGYINGFLLARFYGVSERTIRRDMVDLRKRGNKIMLGTSSGYRLRAKPRSPLERDKL